MAWTIALVVVLSAADAADVALMQISNSELRAETSFASSFIQISDATLMKPDQCFMRAHSVSSSPSGKISSLMSMKTGVSEAPLQTVDDLIKQYDAIFSPSGNRNAASHLWAQYVLSRSQELSHQQIQEMFSGFCPVSGSPLGPPSAHSRFRSTLGTASGGYTTGFTYHCCWPCICDTTDLLKVDTLSVLDKAGTSQIYNFTVMGNPCKEKPPRCEEASEKMEKGCIPREAPAVVCEDDQLQKAVLSDNGHVIMGMYFPESSAASGEFVDYETEKDQQGNTLKGQCEERQKSGFQSGMGAIFQMVARLNEI